LNEDEVGWAYGMHGRKERYIQGLVERPEGKRTLGGPCYKGNDNIIVGLKEVGLEGMDWIDLERTSRLPRKDPAAWSYQ
jgi:hypothetical protein